MSKYKAKVRYFVDVEVEVVIGTANTIAEMEKFAIKESSEILDYLLCSESCPEARTHAARTVTVPGEVLFITIIPRKEK